MKFDIDKTTQAAAVVLKEHRGRISRLRLLKLLYIADRESIQETLDPIVADRFAAMDHGPILSQTYDVLRGMSLDSPAWERFIVQEGPRDHVLACDPGVGKLSRYEVAKLTDVCQRHWFMNDYDIAEVTHLFPEWEKNKPAKGSSRPIPLVDLLEAIGRKELLGRMSEDAKASAEIDHLLESVKE